MWTFIVVAVVACLAILFRYYIILWKRARCSLENEIVLITGAGSGFGKALCHRFAAEKCTIICVDIDTKNNEATACELRDRLQGSSARVVTYTCDVSNRDQVNELANKVHTEFGHLDILVNNAGIAHAGFFHEFPHELLKKTIDVNLLAHFWTLQAFVPQMLKRNKGYVIGIASVTSFVALPEAAPYSTSKFAVLGLMESLKAEFGKMGSRVKTMSVHPTFMATNILHGTLTNEDRWWIVEDPRKIAKDVINGIKDGRSVVISPCYYKLIVVIHHFIPKFVKDNFLYHIVSKVYTEDQSVVKKRQ